MFAHLVNKFIVAMWALVASASTGYVRNERDIGISSGYGGAFGYDSAPSAVSISKYLQSGSAPQIVNPNKKVSVAISNGYGEAYGYTSTPVVNNRDLPSSLAISSGYGGKYGYIPTSKVVKKKLLSSVAIPSAYGGAYGYDLSTAAISNGYRFTLPSSAVNVNSQLQSDVAISSGYGGAYGYITTSRIMDRKDLPYNDVVPGSYGSSPISIGTIKNVMQKVDMSKVQHTTADKMLVMPQLLLNYLPGYSGYGNGISSYSGYSRSPIYPGYGFAYANGWL